MESLAPVAGPPVFLVTPGELRAPAVTLSGPEGHHAAAVRRLRAGERAYVGPPITGARVLPFVRRVYAAGLAFAIAGICLWRGALRDGEREHLVAKFDKMFGRVPA